MQKMTYKGGVRKLKNDHVVGEPVKYSLPIGDQNIALNTLLGKELTMEFLGNIQCIFCERVIKKSYSQGYCFPCSQKLARCDFCIVKPEKCHFHLGTCREPEWGKENCFIPHIVYLANTSGLKVGITRETQIPIRWIDQGASQALPIFRAHNRYQSGLIEVALKQHFNDRTDWRKMLQGEGEKVDLKSEQERIINTLDLQSGDNEMLTDANVTQIIYPVLEYPNKVQSLNFEKIRKFSGMLLGIKGQYLIFDIGVVNIRNLTGFNILFSY